jgi:hypothetical protein
MSRRAWLAGGLLGAGAAILAWRWQPWNGPARNRRPVLTTYEDLTGCRYTGAEQAPLAAIRVQVLPLPEFPGAWAIWGATGRDARGHVWVGVSAHPGEGASARLFEHNPATGAFHDRGDVVGQLRRCGLARAGEAQSKIHSRIVQADDGDLYFASMDEQGERTDGSQLPTWGSHLWRLNLSDSRWEHLLAVPQGLIAVAAAGRWVYALGYFNHVLYQFDCRTGATQSVAVGSVGGHISRNFFTDAWGHAYVPRVREAPGSGRLVTTLVEYDTELGEVMETPLAFYTATRSDDSHGVTGFQPLADRSIVFVTDQGYLHRVRPQDRGPAPVETVGWVHPERRTYIASLFTSDGSSHVMGAAVRPGSDGSHFDWVVYDLAARVATAVPLPTTAGQGELRDVMLYGSVTRDNEGGCYLGGFRGLAGPLLIRVGPAA